MRKYLLPIMLPLMSLCAACSDDDGSPSTTLSGQVVENVTDVYGARIPLSGAVVILSGSGVKTQTTQTDLQGRYSFSGLDVGGYLVSVSCGGYESRDTTAHIYHLTPQKMDVKLAYNRRGSWLSADSTLRLNLAEGIYTLTPSVASTSNAIYRGFYDNTTSTDILFRVQNEEGRVRGTFRGLYFGKGAIQLQFDTMAIAGHPASMIFNKN